MRMMNNSAAVDLTPKHDGDGRERLSRSLSSFSELSWNLNDPTELLVTNLIIVLNIESQSTIAVSSIACCKAM